MSHENSHPPKQEVAVRPEGMQMLSDRAGDLLKGVFLESEEGYDSERPYEAVHSRSVAFPINGDEGDLYISQFIARKLNQTKIETSRKNNKLSNSKEIVKDLESLELTLDEHGKVIDYEYEFKHDYFPIETFGETDWDEELIRLNESVEIEDKLSVDAVIANVKKRALANQRLEATDPVFTKKNLMAFLDVMNSVSMDDREIFLGTDEF